MRFLLFECVVPILAWQQPGPNPEDAAAAAAVGLGTMMVVMVIGGLLSALMLALAVFLYYILYSSLARIPPQHRKMEPGQVFLLLIPFFNLYWMFVVHTKIPQSFQSYFHSIGRKDVGDCGEQLGLWTAIAAVCNAIPCINCISAPASIVMLILMLSKFWSLRNQIPVGKFA